jgi:hypothetical protein
MVIARAAPGKCETPCATQRKGNSHEITLSVSYVLGGTRGKLFIFYFYVCIKNNVIWTLIIDRWIHWNF